MDLEKRQTVKVYLDNCCYNRPYDDQTQLRISLETQAKLQIQSMIRNKEIELASSYVLLYENSRNPHTSRQKTIRGFVRENVITYIDIDHADEVKALADEMIASGLKTADAYHVACAILANSDYFLTTDDRLLKYKTDKLRLADPTEFIREWEASEDEDDE